MERNPSLSNKNTPWLPTAPGRSYTSPMVTAIGTMAMAINKLYAIPILITQEMTVSSVSFEITVQASGKNARLGVYADNNGVPGALLIDGGFVSETGTGNKPASVTANLPAGWYWLALVSSGTPTIRVNTQASAYPMLGFASGTDTTTHIGWTADFTYGTGTTLPDPFTAGGQLASGSMPRIMLNTQ